jgi:hypothetical protein
MSPKFKSTFPSPESYGSAFLPHHFGFDAFFEDAGIE